MSLDTPTVGADANAQHPPDSPLPSNEDEEFEHERQRMLILYATTAGNALDAAEQIFHEASSRGLDVEIKSADEYPPSDLILETLIVFVLSTTGTGQEPRSLTPLFSLLMRAELPSDLFEGTSFAVFGLGDSSYEKFCWAAKKVGRRMRSLGAKEVVVRGEADDQAPLGIDGALDEWMPKLFDVLEAGGLCMNKPPENAAQVPPPRISIKGAPSPPLRRDVPAEFVPLPDYYAVTVRCNKRITASDWYQDVRHIEFDFKEDIEYRPGDVAVIHPIAPKDDVRRFLEDSGWSDVADDEFAFEQADGSLPVPLSIPRTTTLRTLFSRYLDISCIPRRSFFKFIRYFAQDASESERLHEFCSAEGSDDLYEYAHRVRRTISEVLAEFHSIRIPREYIFDVFPLLRPREFSIASSVRAFPRQVHLCVAIVNYKTRLKVPRRGVCTTYLASMKPGFRLHIGLQKGLFSFPDDPSTPIICIGPGTGVAPMRSLIYERVELGAFDNTLYFGCRKDGKDHHYAEEWRALASSGKLSYNTAFSRDDGSNFRYVQDHMRNDGDTLWRLIHDENAWIYISGSSNKMPKDVKHTIQSITEEPGGLSSAQAADYVNELYNSGRVTEECWS